jgi:para-nitrobenzyl esterase
MAAKGVIVVSINYLVGVFGYLALPQLDYGKENSRNFGLQDKSLD